MSTEIELQGLFALKSAALRNQEEITRSIRQMNAATAQFQALVRNLPQQVAGGVRSQLASAIDATINDAADRIVSKQEATNTKADMAERAYARAVRWSFMRLFLVCLCFFAVGILGMVMAAKHVLPDYETIKALRQEKAQLEKVISDLEIRGGKVRMTTCNDGGKQRLCVRTDETTEGAWGKDGETYRIIYGY